MIWKAFWLKTKSDETEITLHIFVRILLLLYADYTIIMAETENSIKDALTAFEAYCNLYGS